MINERKLSENELDVRFAAVKGLLKNKAKLVKKYGADAEKVMYGIATKQAKKKVEKMNLENLRGMIEAALQNPDKADLNKDGKLSDYEKKRGAAIEKNTQNELFGSSIFDDDEEEKVLGVNLKEDDLDENKFLSATIQDLEQVIRNIAHTGEMSEDEAIEMAIRKLEAMLDGRDDLDEDLDLVHVYDKDGKMFGTGERVSTSGDKTLVRFDGSTEKEFDSSQVKNVKEDLDENVDKVAGGIPYRQKGNTFVITEPLDDATKERIIKRAKEGGYHAAPNQAGGITIHMKKGMNEHDLDMGHQDDEPKMLKADLYRIAKYAGELYKMMDAYDDMNHEVDFPHWWQAKVIKARDYMVGAKHYLDGEEKVDQIDAMMDGPVEEADNSDYAMKIRSMRNKKSTPKSANIKSNVKLDALKKRRAQVMRDMEQEAEMEGGEVADRYGDELNKIDAAISKLSEADIELSKDQMDKLHDKGSVNVGDNKVMYKVNKEELAKKIKEAYKNKK